jgi:hypothetical protein
VAILLHMEMAETSIGDYDALTRKVGGHGDPPEGLIVHTATPMEGGGVRVMDVWESQEQLERFEAERIMPAAREVWGEPSGGPPRREITEIHDLWKP